MLKIEEGAVWPPKPEQVTFSESSWDILRSEGSMCAPRWAAISELGGDIGRFLIINMDVETACAIGNGLLEQLEGDEQLAKLEDKEPIENLSMALRNGFNLESQNSELFTGQVACEDNRLILEGATV